MRVQLAARIQRDLSKATGLSEADYEILAALVDAPGDAVRAIALRCGLQWEKSRLSHQLRRMEQRGLIARQECEEDGRGAMIVVTDEGRRLALLGQAEMDAAVRRYVTDVLRPGQLAELGGIAELVLAGLGPRSHGP